jgi:hypothetical protein
VAKEVHKPSADVGSLLKSLAERICPSSLPSFPLGAQAERQRSRRKLLIARTLMAAVGVPNFETLARWIALIDMFHCIGTIGSWYCSTMVFVRGLYWVSRPSQAKKVSPYPGDMHRDKKQPGNGG